MVQKPFLVIAYDRLGSIHAGPSIRMLALAGELAKIGKVVVVYEGDVEDYKHDNIEFVRLQDFARTSESFAKFSAALVPPLVALTLPEILESEIPVTVDLFDPVVWENLELYSRLPVSEQEFQHERHLAALLSALFYGDFFLVAGHRQQDLFLGALMTLNRVNPAVYNSGDGIDKFLGYVPFGLPESDPAHAGTKKIPEQYKTTGPLVVWGGGMWDWLAPEIIVEAMPRLLGKYPDLKLAFPGTVHPNPHVPEPMAVKKVKSTVSKLGIERSVIFSGWLKRDEFIGLLLRADCGTSAHRPGLESRYAVRTRFLDAFWTGLPLVVSGGDEYSGLIEKHGVGYVIDDADPEKFSDAVARSIELGKDEWQNRFEPLKRELTWEKTSEPLIKWAKNPTVTHTHGASFFRGAHGEPSPRERPNDPASLARRLIRKLFS